MKTSFTVTVARQITEYATLDVRASSLEEAEDIALEAAASDNNLIWRGDDEPHSYAVEEAA